MVGQPVALQGRHQRVDVSRQVELGPGHGQQGKGHHKGADHPVFVLGVDDAEDQHDAPGKEDHRFVEVGQGGVAHAHVVGFLPAQAGGHGLDGKADPGQHGAGQADLLVATGQVAEKGQGGGHVKDGGDVEQ